MESLTSHAPSGILRHNAARPPFLMHSPRRSFFLIAAWCLLASGGWLMGAATPMQRALGNWLNYSSASQPAGSPWRVVTRAEDTVDGAEGMLAPALEGGGESWIEASVTGPDTLTFFWALKSPGVNSLRMTLGGVQKASCEPTPEGAWEYESVNIPEGTHTVRWAYRRGNGEAGKAMLDTVQLGSEPWPHLAASPWAKLLANEPVDITFPSKSEVLWWGLAGGQLPPGLVMDEPTGRITGSPTFPGFYRPLFVVSTWTGGYYIHIGFEVQDKPSLAGSVDATGFTVSSSATDANASVWTPQRTGGRDGGDCIAAGAPPPQQRTAPWTPGASIFAASVNGPDVLSYWVKVASGRLTVLLDGKEYRAHARAESVHPWQRAWLTIPAGAHTVTWAYEPWQGQTPTAWLDDIRLQSSGRPFLCHQPDISPNSAGDIAFKIPCTGPAAEWQSTALPAGLSLNKTSGFLSGNPAKRGVWLATIRLGEGHDGDEVPATIDASIPPPEALDLPGSWWNCGSSSGARWFGQNEVTHDGADALRSPPAPHGTMRSAMTTLKGPATVRWWWRSAGSTGDTLSFTLEGKEANLQISGTAGWQQATIELPAGLHDVAWRWQTDSTGDVMTEAAYLDQIMVVRP
jgi:hypothetical protein